MTATAVRASAAELRAALDELRTMGSTPRVRLARAEASFRLALAAGTPPAEGVELLREALREDPYLVKAYLHLGRLLHRAGRYREAVPEYLAALEYAPGSRRIQLLLAEALIELGKDEQQAGDELIAALADRRPERLTAALAGVDVLLDEPAEDAAAPKRGRPPSDLSEIWQVWLLAQLSRRGTRRASIVACLRAGAKRIGETGPSDFAVGCLLLLLSGDKPSDVRKVVDDAEVDVDAGGDPAVRALAAGLELAETADPVWFARSAAEHVATDTLPLPVVCSLHFQRFGPGGGGSVTDALRLLDVYPSDLRANTWFQELRIAILDGFARRAWDDGAPVPARLLWRETLALDPHRVPVAVNLALAAARLGAAEEYAPAWERLFELTYLLAAGVGDVQLLLGERRDLHLALTLQSWQRHCGDTPPSRVPSDEQLDEWVADADALEVWLREWDGYHLNTRLSFRSPVHLLGAARDAGPDELTAARDALTGLAREVVADRGWAGGQVFAGLVEGLATDAYDRSAEPVDRARDLHFEDEKVRADAVAEEMVTRTLVLRGLLGAMARVPATAVREGLAAAVIGHQRALPRPVLQRTFVNRGQLQSDIQLADVFDSDVIQVAAAWVRAAPDTEAGRTRLAAGLDELVRAVPRRLALRVYHCEALYHAGQPREAYRAALAGVTHPCDDEGDDARHYREILAGLIDGIGVEDIRRYGDGATIEQAAQSLERYPESLRLRALLADAQLSAGGEALLRAAATVLVTGIVRALPGQSTTELGRTLSRLPAATVAGAVRVASAGVRRETAERLQAGSDPAVRREAVTTGLGRAGRCRELARRYAVAAEVTALDEMLARLRQIDQRLRDGEE